MDRVVWIPHKDFEWILGEILEDKGDSYLILEKYLKTIKLSASTEPQTILIKKDAVVEFDPSHIDDLDDLCQMNNLHEAPLLYILNDRWINDKIYSYSSDVLISINPYKIIHGLYDQPLRYFDADGDMDDEDDVDVSAKAELPPHVYFIANSALKNLLFVKDVDHENFQSTQKKLNQSVIISGESGAGKS